MLVLKASWSFRKSILWGHWERLGALLGRQVGKETGAGWRQPVNFENWEGNGWMVGPVAMCGLCSGCKF